MSEINEDSPVEPALLASQEQETNDIGALRHLVRINAKGASITTEEYNQLKNSDEYRGYLTDMIRHEMKFAPEEEVDAFMSVISNGEYSHELKVFAARELCVARSADEVNVNELRAKMDFLKDALPEKYLNWTRTAQPRALHLLRTRTSALKAMKTVLGESWYLVLEDEKESKIMANAFSLGRPIVRFQMEKFKQWEANGLKLEADEEAEPKGLEVVGDVLKATGIDQLAAPLVSRIVLKEADLDARVRGANHSFNGELQLMWREDTNEHVVTALLHELGHALEKRFAAESLNEELFDRYIIYTQIEKTAFSPYANAYKELGEHAYYIAESFAEDFKAFMLKPESLSDGKKAVMEELCEKLIPMVNLDELRTKIKRVLGNFFGTSVEQLLHAQENIYPNESKQKELRNKVKTLLEEKRNPKKKDSK